MFRLRLSHLQIFSSLHLKLVIIVEIKNHAIMCFNLCSDLDECCMEDTNYSNKQFADQLLKICERFCEDL